MAQGELSSPADAGIVTAPDHPPRLPDDTADLLTAAAGGDQRAWETLVDRYANLVWSVARSFRLGDADAADVSQATWLRLVQHLRQIREPERLGAWLATTARREALALLRRSKRDLPFDEVPEPSRNGAGSDEQLPDHRLLRIEQRAEVRAAIAALPMRCQQLLRVLLADPPPSYETAAAAVGMPVGSVGPTRSRCLEHLRSILQAADRA